MGKRTRKTRWRTLPIGDEQSDSEESNLTLDTRLPPTYQQKYYSRFTYSSQSTPIRRYQSDGTKSTRSSSTTSENKITFNEDEYTRITTPRQDVLFKKGYLNKPKNYSTQTSTGNSTNSTGNSTGNGTPDYQSTDLEYESQFVFPNGFLDHNGIYYINGYDPYSLMVYNATPYYGNDTCSRTKKYSTESLAETASTSNEENSQDGLNQNDGEVKKTEEPISEPQTNDVSHHPPHMSQGGVEYGQVYNIVYPGYYYNGVCPPQEMVNGEDHQVEPKRIKRRRRRKLSQSERKDQNHSGTTSDYTDDEPSSCDEEQNTKTEVTIAVETNSEPQEAALNQPNEPVAETVHLNGDNDVAAGPSDCTSVTVDKTDCDVPSDSQLQPTLTDTADTHLTDSDKKDVEVKVKYNLKPDAEEFVPRSMRPENLQYFKIPPNFVPVPLLSPISPQGYAQAYFPPGIPVNFPPMYPGYIPTYVSPNFNPEPVQQPPMCRPPNGELNMKRQDVETSHDIDIRTVVSKLEEVANETKVEGCPERKERQIPNTSPYKRSGQQRQFDERKKFYPRNNAPNVYNQRRPHYNKFQNHNEVQQSKETVGKLENKVDNVAPVIVNGFHDEPVETQKEEIELGEAPSSIAENPSVCDNPPIATQQKKADASTEITPPVTPEIQKKTLSAPKQQPRMRPNSSEPIRTIRENVELSSDPRKRWPRKDEKHFELKDQTVQYPDQKSNYISKQTNSPTHRFNGRFNSNSPTKNPSSNFKTKFSDTLKKSPPAQKPVKVERVTKEPEPATPEVPNTLMNRTQWIPVSSKKKRRNRNVEDTEENFEVPEKTLEETKPEEFQRNEFLENIIVNGSLNVTEPEKQNNEEIKAVEETPEVVRSSPVKILEVRELEKEFLSSVNIEVIENKASAEMIEEQVKQPKTTTKKKAKKSGQKPLTKRVIITDIDLSQQVPETNHEEVIEEKVVVAEEVSIKKEIASEDPEIKSTKDRLEASSDNVEKKTKKKKKKQQQKVAEVTTAINGDDTYDFLLENTTLVSNSDDKTNMEISQELDLIIQRGMYSNLEEKIKSLNIIPIKDEFFQSVVRSSREQSVEKSPEFSKLLSNSMPKFKYCMASVEDPLTDLNEPSTSKNGMFVENLEVNELLKDIYGKEGTPEVEILNVTPPETQKEKLVETIVEEETSSNTTKEKLYPITEAVKNWLTKTRENTPDVEILKSPSVIFKEFCEESDAVVNGKRSSVVSESDDEVTVYSASRNNSDGVDLLDCWENEIPNNSDRKSSIVDGCDKKSKTNGELEVDDEDDGVLEVYESKYGQNEDFLELQKEIEEKKKLESDARSRNFPKHGALPYRAICCNLM